MLDRFCVYKGGQVYYSKNYTKQALQSKGYSSLFLVMVPQDPVFIIHLHEVTGYITQILHLFFTFNRFYHGIHQLGILVPSPNGQQ